jgi:hypothetical protein
MRVFNSWTCLKKVADSGDQNMERKKIAFISPINGQNAIRLIIGLIVVLATVGFWKPVIAQDRVSNHYSANKVSQIAIQDQGHPFLLVTKSMYPELQARANHSPWAEMKSQAVTDCENLNYDPSLGVRDKAWRMRDITSACSLAYILVPTEKEKFKPRLLAAFESWDDLAQTLDEREWNGVVPQGSAFFNAVLALDILHDDLSPAQLAQAEAKLATVGEWFWEPGRKIRSEQSWYATRGIWALYKGDRARIDSAKNAYRRTIFEYLTPDGVYTNSLTYAQHRFSAIRDAKTHFMDVLEFTGEDNNYYNDPRLQRFYEWLFGQALTPFRRLYTFGDTSEDYAPAQNRAASYRAHRFSALAAGHAAWLNQGLTPEGRLITYLLHDKPLPQTIPPASRIDFSAGAWFYELSGDENSLSGALWNPIDPVKVPMAKDNYTGAPAWSHAHKDVNAIHLAAYGEHVLRNSGYAGAGKGAAGSSWTYIHSTAESSNTVMIDGANHNGGGDTSQDLRVGYGIIEGFVTGSLDYASGDSGEVLPNGKHIRNFVFVHPQGGLPGYFLLFDEVTGIPGSKQANVILHPNSDKVTTIKSGQEYDFQVSPKTYSSNKVGLTIFQGTPPESVNIKEGALASWDYAFAGKYLYSNYNLGPGGQVNIVTVLFPHDEFRPKAPIKRVSESGFSGAHIELNEVFEDVALESDGLVEIRYAGTSFQGMAALFRMGAGQASFYFIRQGRSFSDGSENHQGFEAGNSVTMEMRNKSGAIISPGTSVKVFYPGIHEIRLNGNLVELISAGEGWASFFAPAGTHAVEVVSTVDISTVHHNYFAFLPLSLQNMAQGLGLEAAP